MVSLVTLLQWFFAIILILVISQYADAAQVINSEEIGAASANAVPANFTEGNLYEQMNSGLRKLSRRKRYIAFPEGSSFSVAFCTTIGMIGNPEVDYLSWALNWGLAYDLPNGTWVTAHRYDKLIKPVVQRRHRRDLYNRIETAIDNMGYNGRSCILRALCESVQYFMGRSTNMVEELVRLVFTLPYTKSSAFDDNDDLHEYDAAHRSGRQNTHCPTAYRDCSISLIELAFGRYSKPMNFM